MRRSCLVLSSLVLMLTPSVPLLADSVPPLRAGLAISPKGDASMPSAARTDRSRPGGFRQVEEADSTGNGGAPRPVTAMSEAPSRPQLAPITYIVMEQPLESVVAELGRLAGFAPNVSREVRGRVNPGRLAGRPDALLDELRRQHNLVTMREGGRLHIAAESESITRIMRTGSESASRIREVLRTLDVDDLQRRITVDETAGLVQINAPAMIAERIETLLTNASRSSSPDATGGITLIRFGKRSAGE